MFVSFSKVTSFNQSPPPVLAKLWMPYEVIRDCESLTSWTGDARAHLAHLLRRAPLSLSNTPRRATKFPGFDISEELFDEITQDWHIVRTSRPKKQRVGTRRSPRSVVINFAEQLAPSVPTNSSKHDRKTVKITKELSILDGAPFYDFFQLEEQGYQQCELN